MNATPETFALEQPETVARVTSGGVGSGALLGSVNLTLHTMKITLELEYEIDGEEPDQQDVIDLLSTTLTRCLMSEEVGKPDLWALMPKECSIHILPNT